MSHPGTRRRASHAALNFYKKVFGGEQILMTYGAMVQADVAISPDDGFCIMAFDVQAARPYDASTNAFFLSLQGSSADEVQARWTALADRATVVGPIGPAPWSALYGMPKDRFGITCIVDVEPKAYWLWRARNALVVRAGARSLAYGEPLPADVRSGVASRPSSGQRRARGRRPLWRMSSFMHSQSLQL